MCRLFGMSGGIWLRDLRVIDLSRPHAGLKRLNRVIGINVNRIIYLHLQDQVRTTLQIESEMNPVLQR